MKRVQDQLENITSELEKTDCEIDDASRMLDGMKLNEKYKIIIYNTKLNNL